MSALIGLLGGFLARLLPEGIKIFQDSRDKKHELEILRLQSRQQESGQAAKMEEVYTQSMAAVTNALQQSYRSEIKHSGKYSASVRPTVTYLFVLSFIGFKAVLLWGLMFPPLPWQGVSFSEAAKLVWGEEETTIFAAIVSFWFGDRTLSKR